MAVLLILLLSSATAQDSRISGEEPTPASLLGPRNFNHHAYFKQYLENEVEPTKQGPVLFPNDAPPPPKPPLIVTSRPLIESISRSELNPNNDLNNSIAESTQIKSEFRLVPDFSRPEFRLKPGYLSRVKDYRPFVLSTPVPVDYGPYGGVNTFNSGDNEFEDHSVLPPIYKAIADHAQHKVLNYKQTPLPPANYDYQHHTKPPQYAQRYQHNDVRDNNGESDYDHASNYAFSYTVRDHKTGDDFSHSQQSTGSATNGEYRVRLPDGRMQIVSYTADENGYNANVRYDDEDKTAGNSIDYNHNNHDYDRNRHDYTQNVHDYNRNAHNYPDNRQDYTTKQDYGQNNYVYDVNRDYVQSKNYAVTKPPPVKEDYNQYSDSSKDYYNTDYSLEYDGKDDKYAPHKSKFSPFIPQRSNLGTIVVKNQNSISSTVRPSYEELKPLFVTKNLYNAQPTQNYLRNIEINVPSTTPNPLNYDGTTEHVVIIGTTKPNLYTNIRNQPLTATPTPVTTPNSFVTPKGYLISTIAHLKNGEKPVLSDSFVDRINKYLTFT